MDARTIISSHAQALRLLCETSQATVIASKDAFLGGFLFSTTLLPASIVNIEAKKVMDFLVDFAAQQISTSISLFGYTISGEMSISALGTNAMAYLPTDDINRPSLSINTYRMGDGSLCRCLPLIQCLAPAAIYSNVASQTVGILDIDQSNSTRVKGMKTDCYPFSSLLASTLECYYDSSCLQLLVSNLSSFPPLNSTQPSRHAADTTVQGLANQLMREDVISNYSIEAYFNECAPRTCDYTYLHRNTLLTTITTIICVVGGLNAGLHFIAPLLVELLMKLKRKFCSHPNTVSTVVSSKVASGKVIHGRKKLISRRPYFLILRKPKVKTFVDSISDCCSSTLIGR
jgi:hypothetical protein